MVHLIRRFSPYGFHGDFDSWELAVRASTGYSDPHIVEKHRIAAAAVRNGTAPYERDSMIFDRVEYSWLVVTGLLDAAVSAGGSLSVLDFGGAFGTVYRVHRPLFESVQKLEWSIVEQEEFADIGNREFVDGSLRFYRSVDACLAERRPNALLLGGVLQYIEDPYEFLGHLLTLGFSHLVIDRTPFVKGAHDRITVQRVPPRIYRGGYPAWIFGEDRFERFMSSRAKLAAAFESGEESNVGGLVFRGFIYRLRRDHGTS